MEEALLVWLLVAVIVIGIGIMVVRVMPIDNWLKQAATYILAGIFLVILLVKVLLPLLHVAG